VTQVFLIHRWVNGRPEAEHRAQDGTSVGDAQYG
jgi:hypothetical protein